MTGVIPPKNYRTGVCMDERSFVWTIENFHVIAKGSRINSLKLELNGDEMGQPYLRAVFLQEERARSNDRRRFVAIYYDVEDHDCPLDYFYCIKFAAKNNAQHTFWSEASGLRELSTHDQDGNPIYQPGHLIFNNVEEYPDSHLFIHITFQLFNRTPSPTMQPTMEEFQVKFSAKARKDLAGLLQNPIPCNDIKIVANDNKEFTAQKGILAVRSPIFATMFQTNMTETNCGVVKLPDISSTTLQVLLTFIYTGEIHPDWKLGHVLLELTNAAAKYELLDLLEFLDVMLGKVCDLENVVPLFILANKLSLKMAEKELLKFVRETGTSSTQNLAQMLASGSF